MSKSLTEIRREFEDDFLDCDKNDLRNLGINADEEMKAYDEAMSNAKPTQYDIGIDTFTRMRANATFEEAMGFIRWNIDKYNTRKKGQDLSDYNKIKDYCDEAIWWIKNANQ